MKNLDVNTSVRKKITDPKLLKGSLYRFYLYISVLLSLYNTVKVMLSVSVMSKAKLFSITAREYRITP